MMLWGLKGRQSTEASRRDRLKGTVKEAQCIRRSPSACPAVDRMSRIHEKKEKRSQRSRLWNRTGMGWRKPSAQHWGSSIPIQATQPGGSHNQTGALQSLLGGQMRGGRKCMKWKLPAGDRMRGRTWTYSGVFSLTWRWGTGGEGVGIYGMKPRFLARAERWLILPLTDGLWGKYSLIGDQLLSSTNIRKIFLWTKRKVNWMTVTGRKPRAWKGYFIYEDLFFYNPPTSRGIFSRLVANIEGHRINGTI